MPNDHSKGTKYRVWCSPCQLPMKLVVHSQPTEKPKHCAFCGGDILIESIRTFPRSHSR